MNIKTKIQENQLFLRMPGVVVAGSRDCPPPRRRTFAGSKGIFLSGKSVRRLTSLPSWPWGGRDDNLMTWSGNKVHTK
jgi:hypothetical protein